MSGYKLVPVEPTAEMIASDMYALKDGCYVSGIGADTFATAQPAPDVTALVELLAEARDHVVSSTQPVRGGFIDEIDTAIAAHRRETAK